MSGDMLTHWDVPRDYVSNLEWRIAVREWAMDNPERQAALRYWCSRDFRLFVLGFCWLFEPRDNRDDADKDKVIPFILWDHQDRAIDPLMDALGKEDVGFDKSRGEGASWLVLMLFLWCWLFRRMNSFGLVSRTELAVDNPDDPDSLMWKLDWELAQLPGWMVPDHERHQAKHTLVNLQNGSTITGYSATGDVARGGRKTAFMMDEIASFPAGQDQAAMNSTQHVSYCRILVSTPKGPFGVFYEAMKGQSSLVKISLKWQENPTRRVGLYRVKAGRPVLIDWKYWRDRIGDPSLNEQDVARLAYKIEDETDNNPFRYRFILKGPFCKEGRDRSPWYDRECRRPSATPRGIAQELDLDYSGSAAMIFDLAVLEKLQMETCYIPQYTGDLLFDHNPDDLNLRWSQRPGGLLQVWCTLIGGVNRPASDRPYIIGADIASGIAGVMSSNSVLFVLDARTCEQAAELASPSISPEKLAWYAYALAHFFRGPSGPAQIVPEVNGTWGGTFVKLLREIGFSNFYRRAGDQLDVNSQKKVRKIGFYSDKNTKPPLISDWYSAVANGECKVRSKWALEEAKHYILDPNGVPVHMDSMTVEDPSGSKGNHGDRVIAAALSWRGRKESGTLTGVKVDPVVCPNSVAGRSRERTRKPKVDQYVW